MCKLGWWAGAPWDVLAYAKHHATYPCDSTLEQLYDATEFEAYQQLGAATVRDAAKNCAPKLRWAPPPAPRCCRWRPSAGPANGGTPPPGRGQGTVQERHMRVYEAIVKGLESIGVTAAFGGAGENAAGLMIALKALGADPPGDRPARAGRVVHGLRLRDVHRPAGGVLRDGRARGVQPVLRARGRDVRLLPGAGDLGLRVAGLAGTGIAQRDLRAEPDAGLAGHVRGHDQGVLPAHRHRRHVRRARGGGQPRVRGPPGPGAHPRAGEPHPPRRRGGELPRHPAGRGAGPARPGAGRGDRGRAGGRDRRGERSSRWPGSAPSAAVPAIRSGASSSGSRSRCSPPWTARASCPRDTRCASASSATAATASAWKAFREAESCWASGTR